MQYTRAKISRMDELNKRCESMGSEVAAVVPQITQVASIFVRQMAHDMNAVRLTPYNEHIGNFNHNNVLKLSALYRVNPHTTLTNKTLLTIHRLQFQWSLSNEAFMTVAAYRNGSYVTLNIARSKFPVKLGDNSV